MGLLAWPVMVLLAILLSNAADPYAVSEPWLVALLGAGEVLAAAVAIVFPIWSFLTWAQQGDEPGARHP
jgi:hypothetical protein